MATVIVELPADRYAQLQRRARAAGKSPAALSRELLEAALGASAPPPTFDAASTPPGADRDTTARPVAHEANMPSGASDAASAPPPRSAREILRDAGHLVELSPELQSLIIPGVTLEQVHAIFRNTEGPSLTDIILEQRGPKE